MADILGFAEAHLGDSVLGNPFIPDPGGSDNGFVIQKVMPGINETILPDGVKVLTDDLGNVIK